MRYPHLQSKCVRSAYVNVIMYMCVCVRACVAGGGVHACMCVCVCVRACVHVCFSVCQFHFALYDEVGVVM